MHANKKLIINKGRALLLAVIAYFCMTQGAQAATAVSGAITANTTWSLVNSPYQVTADISVANGATLTIEAGVVVYFDAGKNLIVTSGALNARGTAGQPITFTSTADTTGGTPAPGNWGQLRFLDGTNDSTTILEYAQIRYGQGIGVQAASPTFNYLQIANNLGSAISIDLNSSPKGIGNQASGNTLNGISVPPGDLTGSVTWGLKGIPYLVSSGVVSVGVSPSITSISPAEIQQSQTINAVISGTRLAGVESIQFDAAGLSATLSGGGSDTSIPLQISASATQPLGNVAFEVKTSAGRARYTTGISVIPLKPTIVVNSITPGSIRRAETKSFQIGGSYLAGAQVGVPGGVGLTLDNLLTTDTQASFNLTASTTATLGSQAITVTNPAVANGTGAMLVAVNDMLPKINTNTIPSAVMPDGVAHPFYVSLTNADTVNNIFNLSVGDATIIGVSPASVTIPAGATSATFNLVGLKLGYTTLTITSPTLASVSKQIYVTNLLNGASIGPVLSAPVGVAMPYNSTTLPAGTVIGPTLSPPVGVSMPYNSITLPAGTVIGLTLSPPVGVEMPCALPPSGLVSWWPGDGNASDVVGTNNGTLKGGGTFATGKVGQAFLLDGIDDFVDVGNASSLHVSGGDFTVDAWVLFNNLAGDMSIVDKMSSSGVNTDGWRLVKQSDNRFWFCLGGGGANQCYNSAFTLFSTTQATTGVWYHVAVVKSTAGFSMYINGQLQDSRASVPIFLDTQSANLRIGSYALQGAYLNGRIDEVEIFNRTLSATEIQAAFSVGNAMRCK